jgi:hypothetical protein
VGPRTSTGRATQAREVRTNIACGSPGRGFGVGMTRPPSKSLLLRNPQGPNREMYKCTIQRMLTPEGKIHSEMQKE